MFSFLFLWVTACRVLLKPINNPELLWPDICDIIVLLSPPSMANDSLILSLYRTSCSFSYMAELSSMMELFEKFKVSLSHLLLSCWLAKVTLNYTLFCA